MPDSVLKIQTNDGIRFSLPLAGLVRRGLAVLIDSLVIGAATSLSAQALRPLAIFSRDLSEALAVLAYFVLSVGYAIALEWKWSGQTLGKRVMNIRVLDAGGLKLAFAQIALRNLLRFIDALPLTYLVAGAAMMLNKRSQRLGDIVAGTVVVSSRKAVMPEFKRVLDLGGYNSLLEIPHLAARLRQRTSPQLARIAFEALLRRDQLNPAARVEVFHELADEFRRLVPFPEEATHALSDESYVRNALGAALWNPSRAVAFRRSTASNAFQHELPR